MSKRDLRRRDHGQRIQEFGHLTDRGSGWQIVTRPIGQINDYALGRAGPEWDLDEMPDSYLIAQVPR